MESVIKYAISFYTERDANINVVNLSDEYPKELNEIFFFCSYTIRMIQDINQKHPVCASLAKSLAQVEDSRNPLLLMVTNPEFISGKNVLREISTNDIRIVSSSQKKVVKGFSGVVQHEGRNFQHIIKPEGFNFLGQGIPYYGPLSVGLLLNYLGQRSYGDKFIKSLSVAAKLCGQTILDNPISKNASLYWAIEMAKLALAH